jgi:hypothetical protein
MYHNRDRNQAPSPPPLRMCVSNESVGDDGVHNSNRRLPKDAHSTYSKVGRTRTGLHAFSSLGMTDRYKYGRGCVCVCEKEREG